MKRIALIIMVVLGLTSFALAVMYGGPSLAIAGYAPLASPWSRALTIAVVWSAVGIWYLSRWWRVRRAERALEAAIEVQGPTGDGEVLGERLRAALAVLRRTSGSRNYLYDLPWYVIIGPPGAGKTTALLNSGIRFPLAESTGGAFAGAGGTRYCDWWFAEEAVLIDTAGRYTTQDSDKVADAESWMSFLRMLKKNRSRQPVNGVIVALSLEDLLSGTRESIELHAAAIRDRLVELYQVFRVDVPVYVLFTKADLVAGFSEFFGAFSASRRQKVWGATFNPKKRNDPTLPFVGAEYDALLARLSAEVTDRMNDEPDGVSRIAIFGFPAQMALLKDRVIQVLEGVFGQTRYRVNATLRGFYFASGTQEGTPIDQILGAIDRGMADAPNSGMSGKGKSYFLHDLLKKVIFAEAGWVSQDRRAVRIEALLRYGSIGGIVAATLALMSVWTLSYFQNLASINAEVRVLETYRTAAGSQLGRNPVSDTDLASIAPMLQILRERAVPTHSDARGFIATSVGLDQTAELALAAQANYLGALRTILLPRLVLIAEGQIAEDYRNDDRLALYDDLKAYIYLGNQAPLRDNEFVLAWFQSVWRRDVHLGGIASFQEVGEEMQAHLESLLLMTGTSSENFAPLNNVVIEDAQDRLRLMGVAGQAELLVMGPGEPTDAPLVFSHNGNRVMIPPVNIGEQLGENGALVFETRDGRPLSDLTIPPIYTYSGFHYYFLPRLQNVGRQLQTEQWVLGQNPGEAIIAEQLERLYPTILNTYASRFRTAWNRQLDRLRLRPLSSSASDYLPLEAISDENTSPLLALTALVVAETSLSDAPEPTPGQELATDAPGGGLLGNFLNAGAAVAAQEIRNRSQGVTRRGIDVIDRARNQSRAGESGARATGGDDDFVLGANVEAQFSRWQDMLADMPSGTPISALIARFAEIRQLLRQSTVVGQSRDFGRQLSQLALNLTQNASSMPEQLRVLAQQASEEFAGGAASTTLESLRASLESQVTRECSAMLPSSYPFRVNSNRDLPLEEFVRIFAPNGVIDRFFNESLLPFADIEGDTWQWRIDNRIGTQLSTDTLSQFQRAAAIRQAYFPAGIATPGFDVRIQQRDLHPEADRALLTVSGTQYVTQQGSNVTQSVYWPTSGGGPVGVQLFPAIRDMPFDFQINPAGPWALLRLIESGRHSLTGSGVRFTVTIGGRHVSYQLQTNVSPNPFDMRLLREFRCPSGL